MTAAAPRRRAVGRRGRLRIGTSGYQYEHWRDVLYPAGTPRREWFARYAARFDTVELNTTFYRLPAPSTFDAWRRQAPAGFCYALKLSRYATHLRRLREPRRTLRRFLRRADRLGEFLGPILVQLPPRWDVDPGRLAAFLAAAPRRHRWALEFRDRRWLCDEVFTLLADHDAALCLHDLIEDHPRVLTADWVYLRFHGAGYASGYSPQALSAQARRIRRWLRVGLDVFVYFNNDLEGHAVRNADDLRRYVTGS